jgi:hypothetical protein
VARSASGINTNVMYGVIVAYVQEWCIPVMKVAMATDNRYLSVLTEDVARKIIKRLRKIGTCQF